MSELERDTRNGPPGDTGWTDLADLPVEAVRELFVVLGKAFRAYQLYDENNPVRHRFIESLRQTFHSLWNDIDRLTLRVEEDRILLGAEEVYKAATRGESLAFLFYKDGVREITFLPGIEAGELEPFLGVLQKARKLVPESDDLLTVLWDVDLSFFQYQYIDFLAEGVDLPVAGDGVGQDLLETVLRVELGEGEEDEDGTAAPAGAEGAQPAPQTVRQEDFNPTLYALDVRETEILRQELHREVYRDLRGDVLSALFDRLEESERPERQSEILDILGILLPNFLSRGGLVPATAVLEELRRLEGTPGILDERLLAQSRTLLDAASSPEAIDELIQALYDGTIRASSQQLSAFLRYLRAGAIAPLLREAETVDHRELREVLRSAVRGIAERNRPAVVRLLSDPDPVIASGAARLAGDIQIAEAGPSLAGLLAHEDADVRLAAVEAAAALKASTAAGPLEHTLDDPEREVRTAAARALGVLRYAPAADRLEETLRSREIRQADISEKVAFFEAYALVAQEQAVPMLDKFLNGRGFLGKREPPEIRAAAALGLGKIEAPSARKTLMDASQEEDPVVRSAVNRALRSED
jgi:hypothetical protein